MALQDRGGRPGGLRRRQVGPWRGAPRRVRARLECAFFPPGRRPVPEPALAPLPATFPPYLCVLHSADPSISKLLLMYTAGMTQSSVAAAISALPVPPSLPLLIRARVPPAAFCWRALRYFIRSYYSVISIRTFEAGDLEDTSSRLAGVPQQRGRAAQRPQQHARGSHARLRQHTHSVLDLEISSQTARSESSGQRPPPTHRVSYSRLFQLFQQPSA